MIVIEHPASRELAALADEIAATEGIPMGDAYALALGSLAGLLADAQADTRYAPSRVVLLMTARELMEWTERE